MLCMLSIFVSALGVKAWFVCDVERVVVCVWFCVLFVCVILFSLLFLCACCVFAYCVARGG